MREGQPAQGDEEWDEEGARRPGRSRPAMSRHYGGPDIYGRRRLYAGLAIVAFILLLFLMLGGC